MTRHWLHDHKFIATRPDGQSTRRGQEPYALALTPGVRSADFECAVVFDPQSTLVADSPTIKDLVGPSRHAF